MDEDSLLQARKNLNFKYNFLTPKKSKSWSCLCCDDEVVKIWENLPANTGDIWGAGLIPGLGCSPGEGHDKPTPVFLPGESHGQRNLEAAVHRVAKSRTQLKWLSTHAQKVLYYKGKKNPGRQLGSGGGILVEKSRAWFGKERCGRKERVGRNVLRLLRNLWYNLWSQENICKNNVFFCVLESGQDLSFECGKIPLSSWVQGES